MLVTEILKDKGGAVYSIAPDFTLSRACAELEHKRVGVLSERDVVRAVARDGQACLLRPVADYMTREVVFAEPGETVAILMGRMTDRRIRHLPVLKDGRLSGVISIGDVVKCQIAEATSEAESLRTYIAAG